MARPPQPIAPAEPLLVVDERTPFVAHSPVLVDAAGAPLIGRSTSLALVAHEDAPGPIHNTLAGAAVDCSDGSYTLALLPRALWLRLAPHANRRIYLRASVPGFPPVHTPLRVVWRADTYPTERS